MKAAIIQLLLISVFPIFGLLVYLTLYNRGNGDFIEFAEFAKLGQLFLVSSSLKVQISI